MTQPSSYFDHIPEKPSTTQLLTIGSAAIILGGCSSVILVAAYTALLVALPLEPSLFYCGIAGCAASIAGGLYVIAKDKQMQRFLQSLTQEEWDNELQKQQACNQQLDKIAGETVCSLSIKNKQHSLVSWRYWSNLFKERTLKKVIRQEIVRYYDPVIKELLRDTQGTELLLSLMVNAFEISSPQEQAFTKDQEEIRTIIRNVIKIACENCPREYQPSSLTALPYKNIPNLHFLITPWEEIHAEKPVIRHSPSVIRRS